eukprot:4401318-Amphidinium_carterae.1
MAKRQWDDGLHCLLLTPCAHKKQEGHIDSSTESQWPLNTKTEPTLYCNPDGSVTTPARLAFSSRNFLPTSQNHAHKPCTVGYSWHSCSVLVASHT